MEASDFKERLAIFKADLKDAQLVGVSKYSDFGDMLVAYEAGLRDFGESKVQDLTEKALVFEEKKCQQVRWHFIGQLQSNKVQALLRTPHLFAIHSVGSLKLLQEIYKRSADFTGESLKIFLQVNTSDEAEKSGFTNIGELKEAIDFGLKEANPKISLYGLMTMGSIRSDDFEEAAHKSFKELANLKAQIQKDYKDIPDLKLSMGMSQDYLIAVSYGADFVRIGSALFK
jgi:PLP dependent protein